MKKIQFFEIQQQLAESGQPYALVIVTETIGSTSAKPGSKAIFSANGELLWGWAGGGCAQSAIAQTAIQSTQTHQPMTLELDFDSDSLDFGMPCGGKSRVYIEPVYPSPRLWVIGQGPLAVALGRLGEFLNLQVQLFNPEEHPDTLLSIDSSKPFSKLEPTTQDFIVIASQHKNDHHLATWALATHAHYVALIASQKKASLIRRFLKDQKKLNEQTLQRLHMPAGIDIGAMTPEEIALSILAEITLIARTAKRQQTDQLDFSTP